MPDPVAGEGPGRLDSHVKITLKFRHHIPDPHEQDSQQPGGDPPHGNPAGEKRLAEDHSRHGRHKHLHPQAEPVIIAAELLIVAPSGVDPRHHVHQHRKQQAHPPDHPDLRLSSVAHSAVHIPVGGNLLRHFPVKQGDDNQNQNGNPVCRHSQFLISHDHSLPSDPGSTR